MTYLYGDTLNKKLYFNKAFKTLIFVSSLEEEATAKMAFSTFLATSNSPKE